MSTNSNMNAAKAAKNDEFYTRLGDVEKEMWHYRGQFEGKVVHCDCDDPDASQIVAYFKMHFEDLGLRALHVTGYKRGTGQGVEFFMNDAGEVTETFPSVDGDFRSPEVARIRDDADIVVTNPPFSLFREYIATLMEWGGEFCVLANMNAMKYRDVFNLFRAERAWYGVETGSRTYDTPDGGEMSLGNTAWVTNMEHKRRHEPLVLRARYSADAHPHYMNHDAINVDAVKNIPADWAGLMGVPVTYLTKHCPEQFEIVGIADRGKDVALLRGEDGEPKRVYTRVLIRNRNPEPARKAA